MQLPALCCRGSLTLEPACLATARSSLQKHRQQAKQPARAQHSMTQPVEGYWSLRRIGSWLPLTLGFCVLPQNVVADSRVVSFYSNATVYQSVPINPTPNAQVRPPRSRVPAAKPAAHKAPCGLYSTAFLAVRLSLSRWLQCKTHHLQIGLTYSSTYRGHSSTWPLPAAGVRSIRPFRGADDLRPGLHQLLLGALLLPARLLGQHRAVLRVHRRRAAAQCARASRLGRSMMQSMRHASGSPVQTWYRGLLVGCSPLAGRLGM